jgi:lipocalin-like protein
MNRRVVLSKSGIALLGLTLVPGAALSQQKSLKEQLVGTWEFVSSNAKRGDGSPLWGQNPKGLFIITTDGHFSWQVFRSDRPNFTDRLKATADEYKTTMLGSLAYFGTYSVNEVEKTITFITEGSTFPHSEGETLKRIVTKLTPDELVYTNPTTTTGAQVEAVWKRVQ